MDQNTRVFYAVDENQEENYDVGYEDGYEQYPEDGQEDGYLYADDYAVYEEEDADGGRFKVAMSVFDMASVLMGVVVILALTTLLVSMVSWLRTDITHSFVLLQSQIQ